MSMPKIEKPENPIEREQSVSNLIESVALMETGLSHILNAEGEKIQKIIKADKDTDVPLEDILKVNDSVGNMVNSVTKLEMILQNKLDSSKDLDKSESSGTTGLDSFGGIYNNEDTSTSGAANVPILVEMPFSTSSRNLSFTTPNSITILKAGTYYITYEALASFNVGATLTIALRVNGENVKETETTITIGPIAPVWYSGTTILDLPTNAVIDMAVISDVDITMTFDEASIPGIKVFKLN